jgi:hypothetical protein
VRLGEVDVEFALAGSGLNPESLSMLVKDPVRRARIGNVWKAYGVHSLRRPIRDRGFGQRGTNNEATPRRTWFGDMPEREDKQAAESKLGL